MGIQIKNHIKKERYPSALTRLLPDKLRGELCGIDGGIRVEEIRLRAGSCVTLTTSRGNIFLESVVAEAELEEIFTAVCEGSLYAHADTIKRGYVTLEGGVRVGICGRASLGERGIIGVYDITGLNFRLPAEILSVGEEICALVASSGRGVLIYSPPGVGKSTLLRSVAYKLSDEKYARRVVVIDTRGELGIIKRKERSTMDILAGYPLSLGIEIATRTMNAELIICDEIGNVEECRVIIEAMNCGVPLLASAHGEDIVGLLSRSGIESLHRAGVFGNYVRIERERADYRYSFHSAKEANDLLEAHRMCAAHA